ncbi:MAG: acyl carrier protein [bacterium]
MNDQEIRTLVFAIVKDVFKVPLSNIHIDMKQDDINEWDSLGHIRLFMTLEERCKIKIEFEDIKNTQSIHDLINLLKIYIR